MGVHVDSDMDLRLRELGLTEEQRALFDYDLTIDTLGEPQFESPIRFSADPNLVEQHFVPDTERIMAFHDQTIVNGLYADGQVVPTFEKAGPRRTLVFSPGEAVSAVVTCGGLCPGLNAVIRGIVMMNHYRYGSQRTYGIHYGFAGLVADSNYAVQLLTPKIVDGINIQGGTILGSSRGNQDPVRMVDRLEELGVSILYTIGGDGTQRGAMELVKEIRRRNLQIGVIGIPKTIDNDLMYIDRSFGMETAFSKACESIYAAHTEAEASHNGIGIVRLMGRESGFIAANATLATNEVNMCLIPELTVDQAFVERLLESLVKRFETKRHAVIVVAEGAGQELVLDPSGPQFDASGNRKLGDIGGFLKARIQDFFREQNIPCTIRYIDPSYIIRSCEPTPNDAIFCSQLAQMAVHAGMSGRTNMIVGHFHNEFVHLPMRLVTAQRKKVSLSSQLWLSVLESTGQQLAR